jgi:YVTN family beta-propeller protein
MKKLLLMLISLLFFSTLFSYDVYIVNSNDETLSHYDTETEILENHIIQLGLYANQIVIHEEKAYVINSGVHSIQVIDLETETTAGHIQCPNGSNPYWMVIHPDGNKAYVTGLFTNTVYVLDLINSVVSGSIPVGSTPEGMVLHNNSLYIMNSSYGSSSGTVSVIDVNTENVTNTIPVGNNPQFGAVDAYGRLHVVCTGNYGYVSPAVWGKIYVINTTNYNDIEILDIGGSPTKISIHPNGNVYLADGFGLGYMAYDSHDLSIVHSSSELWASGGSFIQIDEDGTLYLGDSMDWINNGRFYIYSESEELLHTLTVGVNPQDAGFYYPGVGVDIPPQESITASNYPNPFSNSTIINFFTTESTGLRCTTTRQAEILIYNIKGQMIEQLGIRNSDLEISYNSSSHSYFCQVTWNGADNHGKKVPNGVYLYKIVSGNVETAFHKMIYLR